MVTLTDRLVVDEQGTHGQNRPKTDPVRMSFAHGVQCVSKRFGLHNFLRQARGFFRSGPITDCDTIHELAHISYSSCNWTWKTVLSAGHAGSA
jgi:hypothetical protein